MHDVVVFISLPLDKILNQWFNKQSLKCRCSITGAGSDEKRARNRVKWKNKEKKEVCGVQEGGRRDYWLHQWELLGNSMGISWWSAFCLCCNTVHHLSSSHPPPDRAGRPEVKVTQRRRLQIGLWACVSLRPLWPTPPNLSVMESEQMAGGWGHTHMQL